MTATHCRAERALLAGAVSGVIVLGVVGRAVMAVLALVKGSPTNLSLRGALEVVAIGGLVGAVGGFLLLLAKRILPASRLVQTTLVALALLVGSLTVALAGGRISPDAHTALPITLLLAAVVFGVYGYVADALLGRQERHNRTGA